MTIKTEVEVFPEIYNWITEEYEVEFYRCTPEEFMLTSNWNVCMIPVSPVIIRWYERPNENYLLNTLTEALEGTYDYD